MRRLTRLLSLLRSREAGGRRKEPSQGWIRHPFSLLGFQLQAGSLNGGTPLQEDLQFGSRVKCFVSAGCRSLFTAQCVLQLEPSWLIRDVNLAHTSHPRLKTQLSKHYAIFAIQSHSAEPNKLQNRAIFSHSVRYILMAFIS